MVGLDIGTKTIKILELGKDRSSYVLKGSGVVGYSGTPFETIEDDKGLSVLAGLISKLYKEAGISKKQVSISLPENKVYTRTIKFPLLTDQEIESAVKWEAGQYVPIPIEEAIIQYQIIERNEKKVPPEVVVLLVSVQQSFVEKYMKLMKMAGLNAVFVESELLSLVRAVAPKDKISLLVDFGASSTDIVIAKNANLVFSRSVPTAGDALTRAVSRSLGVEISQAEEYKKTYGLNKSKLEGKVVASLEPIIKSILDEIKKAMHFYQTEEKGEMPRQVIFSGGSAGLPEVASMVTKELGLEFLIADPFSSNVKMSDEARKTIINYSPLYSIAVGLAMRE